MLLSCPSRYRELSPLEGGPETSVYLLEDRWFRSVRRVQTLFPKDVDPTLAEETFLTLNRIRQPGLNCPDDIAFRGRRIGFVSNFIDAPTLDKIAAHVSEIEALRLAGKLISQVQKLHRCRCFLGYITPSKVFVPGEGALILNVSALGELNLAGQFAEDTLRYCSPEIIRDQTATLESDFYSVGMILYFLLTGIKPFSGSHNGQLKEKVLFTDPLPPRKLNPNIKPELEEAILGLLHKKPEQRINDFNQLREYLPGGKETESARLLSPLVGRKKELAIFHEICRDFETGKKFRFIVLRGKKGVGKTSLSQAFSVIARFQGWDILSIKHSTGDGAGEAARDLLRQVQLRTDGKGTDPSRDVREIVTQVVGALKYLASERPLLLVVSDIYHLEEGSFEVYSSLMAKAPPGIVILAEATIGESSPIWESLSRRLSLDERAEIWELNPLSRQETDELIRTFISKPGEELLFDVQEVCEGNPFFVYEYVRSASQPGHGGSALFRRHGFIPQTVAEQLKIRLSRLTEKQLLLLQAIALYQRPVNPEVLGRILQVDRATIFDDLSLLTDGEFITVGGTLEQPLYSIGHSWLSEVLKSVVPRKSLEKTHQSIAGILENEFKESSDPILAERLTHHLIRSNAAKSHCVKYFFIAIEHLKKANLFRQAWNLLEKALERDCISLDDWKVRSNHYELLYLTGQLDRSIESIKEALKQNPEIRYEAHLELFLGRVLSIQGRINESIQHLEKALEISIGLCDFRKIFDIKCDLLNCFSRINKTEEIKNLLEGISKDLKLKRKELNIERYLQALSVLKSDEELYVDSLKVTLESLKISLNRGNISRSAGRISNISLIYTKLGDWRKGYRCQQVAENIANDIGNRELLRFIKSNLVVLLRKEGRHSESISLIDELFEENKYESSNDYILSEFKVELLKNYIYKYELKDVFGFLDYVNTIPEQNQILTTKIDGELAIGWLMAVVGMIDVAEEIACKLLNGNKLYGKHRAKILLGRVQALRGEFVEALETTSNAIEHLSEAFQYYRTRAYLQQATIILENELEDNPEQSLFKAFEICKSQYYRPLLAEAYGLLGIYYTRNGDPLRGKAHCLRALHVAEPVERPYLKTRIHHYLSRILLDLKDRTGASKHIDKAIDLTLQTYTQLDLEMRESFYPLYLRPLEITKSKIEGGKSRRAPQYLSHITGLIKMNRHDTSEADYFKKVAEILVANLKGSSVYVCLAASNGDSYRLISQKGACIVSPARSFDLLKSDVKGIHVNENGQINLDVVLEIDEIPKGLIHIEKTTGRLSEVEYDFINGVKASAENYLRNLPEPVPEIDPPEEGFLLSNGKRIIGNSPRMKTLFQQIKTVADSNATVIINGESGTGKELVARAIHELSRRRKRPFIAINCASIASELVENELFGHSKGSFTGATEAKMGLFEAASGGTLFLDEISTMPDTVQTSLLRVLQENNPDPSRRYTNHCSFQSRPDRSRGQAGIQVRSLPAFKSVSNPCPQPPGTAVGCSAIGVLFSEESQPGERDLGPVHSPCIGSTREIRFPGKCAGTGKQGPLLLPDAGKGRSHPAGTHPGGTEGAIPAAGAGDGGIGCGTNQRGDRFRQKRFLDRNS